MRHSDVIVRCALPFFKSSEATSNTIIIILTILWIHGPYPTEAPPMINHTPAPNIKKTKE